MSSKFPSRTLTARCLTRRLSGEWWRLSATAPAWTLYLREPRGDDGVDVGGALTGESTLAITWTDDGARLDLGAGGRRGALRAGGALLHEPLDGLYAVLPLSHYDRRERRFWGLVMAIVRLPAGVWLIERLARRRAARGSS